jgi:photosystem II stability/assembly factor-like uncharacterized protein
MKKSYLYLLFAITAMVFQACLPELPTNSGEYWDDIADVAGPAINVDFPSEDVGYVSCRSGAKMFKTTDGGDTWEVLATPSTDQYAGIYGMYFFDENTGFISTGFATANIYKTIDGGQTWTESCPYSIATNTIKDIKFSTTQNGVAAALYGRCVHTADGGLNWSQSTYDLNYSSSVDYNGVSFSDNQTAYMVGTQATILKTTDGGASWITLNTRALGSVDTIGSIKQGILYDVYTINGTDIIVSGYNGIYRSTDSGTSWTQVFTKQAGYIAFDSPTHGFATAGLVNPNIAKDNMFETENGGASWNEITIPGLIVPLKNMCFLKPGLGYGVTDLSEHNIYRYKKD